MRALQLKIARHQVRSDGNENAVNKIQINGSKQDSNQLPVAMPKSCSAQAAA
jgi:hypothetical protein